MCLSVLQLAMLVPASLMSAALNGPPQVSCVLEHAEVSARAPAERVHKVMDCTVSIEWALYSELCEYKPRKRFANCDEGSCKQGAGMLGIRLRKHGKAPTVDSPPPIFVIVSLTPTCELAQSSALPGQVFWLCPPVSDSRMAIQLVLGLVGAPGSPRATSKHVATHDATVGACTTTLAAVFVGVLPLSHLTRSIFSFNALISLCNGCGGG